ncbi:hypothetical protein IL306_011568 [Fusarium sp. DS 682]|nr:hypothetical protein IL306_011568 [Fusarium sp. DS 682]
MYGDNEVLLGKWFRRTGKRDQILLATKFGFAKGTADMSVIDSSGEYCKKACAESLKRLGTDCIDLYYMHRANPKTPIEETMRAMAELKAQGKIKYIGLSEVSSTTLRRACKVAHVDAVQVEYSPFVLDIEGPVGTNLLATCRELGIAVVCYSPLGRGLLTGAYATKESLTSEGDWRTMMPQFAGDNLDANVKQVREFQTLAEKKGYTPAQLALAWLLRQGDDIIPIPGTKRIKYLEENWAALGVQLEDSDSDQAEIREFVNRAKLVGGRAGAAQGFADTVAEA